MEVDEIEVATPTPMQSIAEFECLVRSWLDLLPSTVCLDEEGRQEVRQLKSAAGAGVNASRKRQRAHRLQPILGSTAELLERQMVASSGPSQSVTLPPKPDAQRSELRDKLALRLQEMRSARKAAEPGSDEAKAVKKKLTKKQRAKEAKVQRKIRVLEARGVTAAANKKKANDATGAALAAKRPVYNETGKILFSKFDLVDKRELYGAGDGLQGKSKSSSSKAGRDGDNVPSGNRDLKGLLKKVKGQANSLEKLKASDPAKADEVSSKLKWQTALARAKGVKVKDDVGLLKRSIARQKKEKKRSTANWKERSAQEKARQDKTQAKRTRNLQKRKDGKVTKKIERSKKRGHILPEMKNF